MVVLSQRESDSKLLQEASTKDMKLKSSRLSIKLICLSFVTMAMGALQVRAQEPAPHPTAPVNYASHNVSKARNLLGAKSTIFRFENLRSGAIKTKSGWEVQDFASGFFNPNSVQITITMKMVSDDPKFVFANGQVGTYTKTYEFRPMFGGTDNVYIGSAAFGKANWPVARGAYFTGSVEFSSSTPFYYYMLPVTGIGKDADITKAYFKAWNPMVEPVPVVWDHDLGQFVVPYTNYWHNENSWRVGWHSDLSITNFSDHPVTYTLKHIPFYGAQFNPKNGQMTRYKEQTVMMTLRPHEARTAPLQQLYGWAADQMSSMEGCLLIRPDRSDVEDKTFIQFSVVPNDSGEPMHEVIQ